VSEGGRKLQMTGTEKVKFLRRTGLLVRDNQVASLAGMVETKTQDVFLAFFERCVFI